MKTKQLFSIILALSMAWITSCTDKDSTGVTGTEGTQTFTFNVTTEGQAQTRATAADVAVAGHKLQYILQVLNADGTTLDLGSGVTQETNVTGQFAVKLEVGKEYTCLFWAQYIPDTGDATTASEYFDSSELQEVTLKKPLTAGDECQAFCATAAIPAAPTTDNITVTLVRAVAQINQKSSVKMENYSKVGISYANVPDKFNVLTKIVSGSASPNNAASFEATSFPTNATAGAYPFHSAYVLASGDGSANMLRAILTIYNTASSTVPIQTVTIENVPTKKNYRTNVINTFASATTKHAYTFSYDDWGGNQNVAQASKWDGAIPAGNAGYAFSGGTGADEANAYIIANAADFTQLMVNVNAGTDYDGKYFKLDVDIDLDNKGWTQILTTANPFKGNFNGQFHTVSNLYINTSTLEKAGLFGVIDGNGSISNLHVNGNVKNTFATNSSTGGICGSISSQNGVIENCSFAGSVEGANHVGGIVGGSMGRVLACKNSGNITGTGSGFTSGIAGHSDYGHYLGCYNTGNITGTGTGTVSGIVGEVASSGSVLSGCYNTGVVSSTGGGTVGAICGGDFYKASGTCYTTTSYSVVMSTNREKEFSSEWPVGTDTATAWYANESNDGTYTVIYGVYSNCKFWKSVGSWNAGSPIYPKLWWE